jgi:hypothetical protein
MENTIYIYMHDVCQDVDRVCMEEAIGNTDFYVKHKLKLKLWLFTADSYMFVLDSPPHACTLACNFDNIKTEPIIANIYINSKST